MNKQRKRALIDLIITNQTKIGKPSSEKRTQWAQLLAENGGDLERIRCCIVELEEDLATTNDVLYFFMGLIKSYIEDGK